MAYTIDDPRTTGSSRTDALNAALELTHTWITARGSGVNPQNAAEFLTAMTKVINELKAEAKGSQ